MLLLLLLLPRAVGGPGEPSAAMGMMGLDLLLRALEVTVAKMAWMGQDRNKWVQAGNLHSCQNQILNAFGQWRL